MGFEPTTFDLQSTLTHYTASLNETNDIGANARSLLMTTRVFPSSQVARRTSEIKICPISLYRGYPTKNRHNLMSSLNPAMPLSR